MLSNGERFQALRLLRQGLNRPEVARRLRVGRQSVARWGGAESVKVASALCAKPGAQGGKRGSKLNAESATRQRLLAGPERPRLRNQLVEFRERSGVDPAGI